MNGNGKVYLAVDLGASSGRVLAGKFDGSQLRLSEVHRFENGPVLANDRMYWDILSLWRSVEDGLRAAADQFGDSVTSVGIDTWGVDYALLGPGDELLGNPYNYRDSRTNGVMEQAFARVRREDIFAETGLQFMELNTLYQLLATQAENPRLLDAAESFLMIPDYFHWLLTGEKANEFTDASTTQFYNPRTQTWSSTLFERFGLPDKMLLDLVQPGTCLGKLRRSIADRTRLGRIDVVLPGTHDTASAVMAVPTVERPSEQPDWCYISSGTWSLMGIETPSPIINDKCEELNFTNEGGVGGTTRVLKNIGGLWLVQECRRTWEEAGHAFSWEELVSRAQAANALVSFVNPDDAQFVAPTDMPAAILQFCRDTQQPIPADEGAVIRTALESLALRYRMTLDWLELLTGSRIETVHVVGGGTNNQLLCQMTADACNRIVIAGPVEATAIGNLMMQAVAAGDVGSISEAREAIRQSFPVREYWPKRRLDWDEAFDRFRNLC
jgi:rhamnulokinase